MSIFLLTLGDWKYFFHFSCAAHCVSTQHLPCQPYSTSQAAYLLHETEMVRNLAQTELYLRATDTARGT